MLDKLRNNLERERKIIKDMISIQMILRKKPRRRAFYVKTLNSLKRQLLLLNKAVPEMLKSIRAVKKKKEGGSEKLTHLNYTPLTKEKKIYVTLNKEDRKEFLKELMISEESLKKIKEQSEEGEVEIRKPSAIAHFSNKIFKGLSEKIVARMGSFVENFKKANIEVLPVTYVSEALFSTVLAFVIGCLLAGGLIFFMSFNFLYILIPFGLGFATMLIYYIYPFSEADSVQRKIARELPFATIHMAAIAGADVAPTKIFRIIASSKEYKNLAKEIRKVTAQTDIYGFDLVTSLKNAAKRVSDKRLAELFSGLATNISTGGNLKDYLEKKAENFLLDYKLERQKYTALATTFMDIYISILIAAPLVLMMMLIVMNVAGIGLNLSMSMLTLLIIVVISVMNVIFLFILNMKQPKI